MLIPHAKKLSNADYHAHSAISKSDLDLLANSPHILELKKQGKLDKAQSPSLLLGQLVHKLTLERESFSDEFVLYLKPDKRTTLGKARASMYENSNRTLADMQSLKQAIKISRVVKDMVKNTGFLSGGQAELSFFSTLCGVDVKCRPDYYNPDLGLLIDLKTTKDASPLGFAKSIANFNYHIQAVFYLDILKSLGLNANSFLFIAISTSKPFMIGFYELDTASLEQGRKKYQELLKLYKKSINEQSIKAPIYFDYNQNIPKPVQTLTLPTWKFYE